MGKVTVYCIVSGCTPEIARDLPYLSPYGPIVTSAIESLADKHELSSQDDLCVIAPVDPSGHPPWQEDLISDHRDPRWDELPPESDVRVIPHCVMGDSWRFGFVDGPPPNERDYNYVVSHGYALMVQTYALDIMALATGGRMTPLRLWRLAMQQGFVKVGRARLEGVNYGEIAGQVEQVLEVFSGFRKQQLLELEDIGDVDVVKQRLIRQGYFWMWMAPDRFPVSPSNLDEPKPTLPEVYPSTSRSAIENLPSEVLVPIASSLPLASLLNLASASRSLRTGILGNDYLARVWIYDNVPWWIPVPTQTPKKHVHGEVPLPTRDPQLFPAFQWSADFQLTVGFPAGLDWAYVMRCVRSGSMLNRERIWNTVLDIEYVADMAGL